MPPFVPLIRRDRDVQRNATSSLYVYRIVRKVYLRGIILRAARKRAARGNGVCENGAHLTALPTYIKKQAKSVEPHFRVKPLIVNLSVCLLPVYLSLCIMPVHN